MTVIAEDLKPNESTIELQTTPLVEIHRKLGARMVPFAGWEMPVQYKGVIAEHEAVRNGVGLFDVSHMGELNLQGADVLDFLQYVTCNDVSQQVVGKAQYSAVLNPLGGVIDDIIIYCIALDNFFLCVNAANVQAVETWLVQQLQQGEWSVKLTNLSKQYGQIALQGPKAVEIISKITQFSQANKLNYFSFDFFQWDSVKVLIARTGYTGEDGFELFIPWEYTANIWEFLVNEYGSVPCGLGARDTLRLEAGYPLHGNELSPHISALESGLAWIIKFRKDKFVGKEKLEEQKIVGLKAGLVGFVITGSGIARHGDKVVSDQGKIIGEVTSGTKTPTMGKAIGIARLDKDYTNPGTSINILVRQRNLAAYTVKLPFYSAIINKISK